jgi:glycosyltransferase involved in cell wall biosynthesis
MWLRRDRLPLLASTVRELAERTRADLIHITLGELASLLGKFAVPTGLLLFDSMTRVIEAQLSIAPTALRRAQLRVERTRTQRFEQKWYPRASGLASVSSVDAEWVERVVGCDVQVIEVSVPERFFEPPDRPRSTATVTFVGTLNHEPNADAIRWLCAEIWPTVRKARPDARLVVVGRGDRKGEMTADVRAVVEGVGGTLASDVDDVRPFYWEAAVVIAPMRLGAGMRLKVVHAMACRAPVVATPLALEGVPIDAARHAITATSRDEIVEGILAMLGDRERAQKRADAAVLGVEPLRAGGVANSLEAWWKTFAR